MNRKKIVILVHENDKNFFTYPPFITFLMKEWERCGLSVGVARGINAPINADVIIPHIDLTVLPEEYISFLDQYPVVVNRHVIDISKSRISSNIVGPNDSYSGPVIVKTNRNYGGLPEKRLLSKGKSSYALLSKLHAEMLLFKVQRLGSWKRFDYMDPISYPIFNSLREVPPEVFDNKNLVVEKFLPETDGEFYYLRRWIFFGDKGVNVLAKSRDINIKSANANNIGYAPVPEELYRIREDMKFDYGKFDYVINNGNVVLLDVNRTMAGGSKKSWDFAQMTARTLAEGIWSFL